MTADGCRRLYSNSPVANLQTLLWTLNLLYMPPPRPQPPRHSPQLHECELLPNLEGLGLNYKGVQLQTRLKTKQERPND